MFSGFLGLGSITGLGKTMQDIAMGSAMSSLSTYMGIAPIVEQATQDKMFAEAASGVADAYLNGAMTIYGTIFQMNDKAGKIFAKAGGH